MLWTERQRAMLQEMGVSPWPAAAEPGVAAAAVARALAAPAADAPAAPRRGAAFAPGHPPEVSSPVPAVEAGTTRPVASAVVAESASSAVAQMDWATLQQAVVECTACGLCKGRRQTVFGVGHARAHWMVVGEAPGEQEDLAGEPFVGKSGQLLDNMLRAIGLTRQAAPPEQQVYIANSVKCRPPGNRNPQPDELARCEPFLIRQVALVRPRIILAMGRFAVQSLLRSNEPIGRLRGRVHDYQGVPLVVTYHPAYLLRSPEEKARAWADLCLAAQTVKACTTAD